MSITNFSNELGLTTVIRNSKPTTKSNRLKLINVINKEINYLKERQTLDIEVNENGKSRISFWRMDSEDNSKVLVSIKYKNKIFGFGEVNDRYKPTYFQCNNNVESVINLLETIQNDFKNREDSDDMFKTL